MIYTASAISLKAMTKCRASKITKEKKLKVPFLRRLPTLSACIAGQAPFVRLPPCGVLVHQPPAQTNLARSTCSRSVQKQQRNKPFSSRCPETLA